MKSDSWIKAPQDTMDCIYSSVCIFISILDQIPVSVWLFLNEAETIWKQKLNQLSVAQCIMTYGWTQWFVKHYKMLIIKCILTSFSATTFITLVQFS